MATLAADYNNGTKPTIKEQLGYIHTTCGYAFQAKMDEDFFDVKMDCVRIPGDHGSLFQASAVSLLKSFLNISSNF